MGELTFSNFAFAYFALATKSELEIVPVIHPEAQTLNINPRNLGVGLRQGPRGSRFVVREGTLQGGSWLDRVLHLDPRSSPPCAVWGVELCIRSFGWIGRQLRARQQEQPRNRPGHLLFFFITLEPRVE